MTKLITLFALLLSSTALADANYGRKLQVFQNHDGVFQFGVQYTPGRDPSLYMSFEVSGSQLNGGDSSPMNPVYRAVIDRTSGKMVSAWDEIKLSEALDPDTRQVVTLQTKGSAEASAILRTLRTSVLVIAVRANPRAPVANAYLDLGEICANHPDLFLNVDTGERGCPR